MSAPLHFDVAQGAATVTLSVTPERVTLGETSTLTATVTSGGAAFAAFAAAGGTGPHLRPGAVPAEGTVTFYVNGAAVGTHTLVDGTASMPYAFGAGANTVAVSYSGSPDLAPAAADASSTAEVVVHTPESTPAPPTPTPPPGSDPAPSGDGPATGTDGPASSAAGPVGDRGGAAAEMAHIGGEARTVASLGAVFLALGVALPRIRRS